MSITDHGAPGLAEPPIDEWGDGPAAYAPGERPPVRATARRRRTWRPSSRVLGAMLISQGRDRRRGRDGPGRRLLPARPTRSIYDAIIDLYGRGEPADAVTVAAELQRRGELPRIGGAPYLHTLLANVPIAANAGYYAEIVREKAILRRLVDAGTKIVQIGYAGEGEVDDIVDQRAGRGLQRHRPPHRRGLRPAHRHHGRRPRRDRGDRQPRRPACTACPPASPTSTS